MKLLDILKEVYGCKKDGSISHHAVNFCKKHSLDINGENEYKKLVIAFSMLSNKEKKEKALNLLIDGNTKIKNTDLSIIRNTRYKEVCRIYHPDNKESGDEGIFKFIQETKCAFWHCDGRPKDKIRYFDWDEEKSIMKSAKDGKFF